MTEQTKQSRSEYRREWYKRNPEKQKEYNRRYWARQFADNGEAQKAQEVPKDTQNNGGESITE